MFPPSVTLFLEVSYCITFVAALQCDDCDEYNPCMTSCPKKTCDNKGSYANLYSGCEQSMCVEGCKTPPCPPGIPLAQFCH